MPRMKNAAVRSSRVRDLVFDSGGISVRHLSVVGAPVGMAGLYSFPVRATQLVCIFHHSLSCLHKQHNWRVSSPIVKKLLALNTVNLINYSKFLVNTQAHTIFFIVIVPNNLNALLLGIHIGGVLRCLQHLKDL